MKKSIYIILGMVITIGIFVFLGVKLPDCSIFQYNLMEIITAICVSFGIYYLTKINEEKKNKNNKVEDIIELIQKKIKFSIFITGEI